jgi:hypothetical protein
MDKNVYSILLSDEIIRQVDKVAYANATSRSNMINRILAQYLSFETPEQRTQNIYESIVAHFENADMFQRLAQQTASTLTINSALPFKYNPTVSYRVKVHKLYDDTVGEIKLHFRTQNKQLLARLNDFYEAWAEIEQTNAYAHKHHGGAVFVAEDGKPTKYLVLDAEEDADLRLSENIAAYIELINTALCTFISARSGADVKRLLEEIYQKHHPAGSR